MTTTLIIRPAQIEDAFAMARLHVDTWRAAYFGIVAEEYLANLSYARCQAGWVEHLSNPQGELIFVAEAQAGQVVALASGGRLREPLDDFDADLYVLYVLPAFQGLGCGRLLAERVAGELAGQGYRSLVIWVLKDNPACRFYEKLGGRRHGEKVVEIGGKPLVDVAYVWPNLAAFGQGGPPP